MQTLTRHNALNAKVKDRSRKTAQYYLSRFRWTPEQREILGRIAEKGYIVGELNPVLDTFYKRPMVTDDKKQIIICAANRTFGSPFGQPAKKQISFTCL